MTEENSGAARADKAPVEVVAALIVRDGRFLACQRPENKARPLLWEFAGGKVEPGETREQALARECLEELDIVVEPVSVFREVLHEYPDITIRLTLMRAVIVSGEPRTVEHRCLRWMTPAEAARYPFCPADAGIIAGLASGSCDI